MSTPASTPATALTIVTAASASYGRSLAQLLDSARRLSLMPGHRLVHQWLVYDLGLTGAQREQLARNYPWARLQAVDLSAWPPHVARLAHSYAWKPLLIRDLAHQGRQHITSRTTLHSTPRILWLDAASILHAWPAEVAQELDASGMYLLRGQTALGYRCDPLTLQRLGVRLEILHQPEYAAGVMGFDTARDDVLALIDQWADWALRPEIIAPRDPRLDLHKPEQALLTILVREQEWQGLRKRHTREVDVSSRHPVRWVSTRHKRRETDGALMDALRRQGQRIYKLLDRAWLRLDHLDNTRLGGWRRWLREHFSVYLGREGHTGYLVRAPWTSYYADPFVVEHEGQPWLLVEEYRYGHNRGRLLAMRIHAGASDGAPAASPRCGPPEPVPVGDVHASFPLVFHDRGRAWLLPETCERMSIDVYAFDHFPSGTRLHRRLMYGVDAADSVLFEHDGRWWLMTSLREPGMSNRYLALFHAPHWDTADWTPHPVNGQRLYGDRAWSWGRCAGAVHRVQGKLLRPIHASQRCYGEKIEWRHITQLTPDDFSEEPAPAPPGLQGIAGGRPLHHVSTAAGWWACDTRDRGAPR